MEVQNLMNAEEVRATIRVWFREAIEEIKQLPIQPVKPDRTDIFGAMEETGLAKSQIYKLTSLGEIPNQKFGKRLVFSRRALRAWVDKQLTTRYPVSELAAGNLAKASQERRKQS